MKPNRIPPILLPFLCLVLLVSCTRAEFSASAVQAQPCVTIGGDMLLSVYSIVDAEKPDSMQMVLTDPSGELSWCVDAVEAVVGDARYHGYSSFAMPDGVALPRGRWRLQYLASDGRTISLDFNVDYSDPESAIKRYSTSGATGAFFDPESNLTVLPAI